MIDLNDETVCSLTDATKRLPKRRAGKRPSVSCIYRWAQNGVHGIKLETIQIGGTKCTSIQALQRFFDRLTNRDAPLTRQTRQRRAAIERAESELSKAGI